VSDREITLKVSDHSSGRGRVFSVEVTDQAFAFYGTALITTIVQALEKRIEDAWWEQHSAELLEQLAPGIIAATIRTKLEAQIAKKVLE